VPTRGENGFAELKTRLRGAAFILRSRSPELVRQELFAFLTVYQSLCSLRAEAAQASGIDPGRISLTVAVRIARDHAGSQTAVTLHSVAQARRRAIRDVLPGMTDDPDAGGQPTELEVRADQELAAQILAASVLAPLNLLGPAGAVLATISTPIATKIASWVVVKLAERRVKHAAETVLDAAEAAKLPLDEFIDRAVSDDRRHELLSRTLFIAQDTALRNKRRALGRALAAGVMGDDTKVDEELLFIRAVADVDEMHIRLLQRMLHPGPIGAVGLRGRPMRSHRLILTWRLAYWRFPGR
jgi:hypothetical protein